MPVYNLNTPYAAAALIIIFSIPSIVRLVKDLWRTKQVDHGLYEDSDGVATEESMAMFSKNRSFIVIFITAAIGLVVSFAQAVFAAVEGQSSLSTENSTWLWLLFVAWILTLVQVIDTAREVRPVTRFNRAVINAVSFSLVIALILMGLNNVDGGYPDRYVIAMTSATQTLAAFLLIFRLITIDRRPDIFRSDGRIVDREFKGSLLAWFTFSWNHDLLDLAASKVIEAEDLPALAASATAKNRVAAFRGTALKPTVALWKLILWSFRVEFLTQWLLIIMSTVFDVAPQYIIMKLLQCLEDAQNSDSVVPKAWIWVGILLAVTVIPAFINHRIPWFMWSHLVLPIQSILTALIFEKMMKVKDCKEPPKADETKRTHEQQPTGRSNGVQKPEGTPRRTVPKLKQPPTALHQSYHNITNIFTVDTMQVSNFAAASQNYIYFASKAVVSITFLLLLVGWQSLLAGLVALLLMIPVNSILAKKYKVNQRALMKARDAKTKIITEVLHGIRQIKFSATESQWVENIYSSRREELRELWNTQRNSILMMLASNIGPALLTAFALSTYAYIHGELLPSVAFTALGVFLQLEDILSMIPMLLVVGINAKVSVDRIDSFLQSDERQEITYPGDSIKFDKASVSFPSDSKDVRNDRFVLRDITLEFPNASLSVISGPTGSGKSLLLAAILGEIELLSGSINVPRPLPLGQRHDNQATAADWIIPGDIAFVSQTPWIENATIRDNILFGLPFDPIRYAEVLDACTLNKDLGVLEDGDSTEVGAQGISLSGGQKWRLTLARALYSRASILVLDDIFSAIDAHVGKEVYDKALMGKLAEGRTRILATHHVSLCLSHAQYAVSLSANGTLENAGLVEQLQRRGDEQTLKAEQELDLNELKSNEESPDTIALDPIASSGKSPTGPDSKNKPKKLVEDEKRETGNVKRSVYLSYGKATGGLLFWIAVLLFYLVAQGLTLSRSWWIKIWTSSYEQVQALEHFIADRLSGQKQLLSAVSTTKFQSHSDGENLGYYLGIYIGISIISDLVSTGRFFLIYVGSRRASRTVFKDMTNRVLRTPLRWLDTEPTGRILNRFVEDFRSLDSQLASEVAETLLYLVQAMGIMVASFFVSRYIIIFSLILFAACGQIGRRYIRGARGFKRLQSVQRSPMISHFIASLQGLSTIRAFSKSEAFVGRMHHLIDTYVSTSWHNNLYNLWLGFRLSIFGSIFSSVVAAFVVSTPGMTSGLAGFALSLSLMYKRTILQAIRQFARIELNMNAAERIFEYTQLPTETNAGIENLRASWPEEGTLEVQDLHVGYAEGLPLILNGLTFTAQMNERIGIVGRTGAGKSTLLLTLFRFLEARKGSIIIDGVDISTIKLHDLRSRLAIIPQDPVIFSGTIRSNLDPFDQFSDYQLEGALKRVHLIPSENITTVPPVSTSASGESTAATSGTNSSTTEENINIFLSLSSSVSQSGSNLSQGQRQLLSLARAMLSSPKLLLLDEATSAVDMATDALIQRSIREDFSNTTLLVIAHRLSTVADFDKILVMSDGVAAEFGSPKELLEMENGVFKSMVEHSGEKMALERTILCR